LLSGRGGEIVSFHHKLWVAAMLPACLSLTACAGLTATQNDATTKYATALSSLGDAASTELIKMHDQTVAMNIAVYRLPDLPPQYIEADPTTGKKVPVVQAEIANGEYAKLSGRFTGDWYDTFSSGPQALKAYGQALTDILKADNTSDIKKSSDSLAASLKTIPHASMSGGPIQSAISGLSQELTELAVGAMKAHAIRKIITASHAEVDTVCARIGYEFTLVPSTEHQNDNFAADYRATAQMLVASSTTAMSLHPADREIRSDALSAWTIANQSLTETTTVIPNIVKSSDSCKAANAVLLKTLDDSKVSLKDIQEFFSQSKQASSDAKTSSCTK
jgi:hypothetical protein